MSKDTFTHPEDRIDELNRFMSGVNDAAGKRTPAAGSRDLNIWDVMYYIFNRKRQLEGEKELTPDEWFEHER